MAAAAAPHDPSPLMPLCAPAPSTPFACKFFGPIAPPATELCRRGGLPRTPLHRLHPSPTRRFWLRGPAPPRPAFSPPLAYTPAPLSAPFLMHPLPIYSEFFFSHPVVYLRWRPTGCWRGARRCAATKSHRRRCPRRQWLAGCALCTTCTHLHRVRKRSLASVRSSSSCAFPGASTPATGGNLRRVT